MEPVEIDFMIGGNTETEGKKVEKQMDDISSSSKRAQTEAANLGKAINNTAKQTGNFNSMGFAVQQIVREAPAATMGMNMFFLAISNNIPTLRDAIARTRAENELLKQSGQTSVPVWKQLAGSLFSWQSLMMVGITLVSMYGKDIIDWVGKLLTGKSAIDKTAESQRALNKVFSDFTGQASKKIQDVTRMGIAIQKYGSDSKNARGIIDDFNKTFNTHYTTIEQVKNAYPALSKAAIDAAIKIQAANSLIEKSAQATLKKQEADTKLAPYSAKQIAEQEKMLNKLFDNAKKSGADLDELTSDLISGSGYRYKQYWSTQDQEANKQQAELNQFYRNPGNLWFAQYLAQQRKYGKMIGVENREIQKLLGDVDFKDFSPNGKPPDKPTSHNEKTSAEYNAAMDVQNLLIEVNRQTFEAVQSQRKDSLQKKLDQISIEEEAEVDKIKESQQKIVDAYNKSEKAKVDDYNKTHTDKKKYKPVVSITNIPGQTEAAAKLEQELTDLHNAYANKRKNTETKYYDDMARLAAETADARVKIEHDFESKITEARETGNENYAQLLENERDKQISNATAGMIKETELYNTAMDERLNVSAETTAKLIADIQKRIEAEMAAGKLSKESGEKMLADLNKTGAAREGAKNQNNPFAQLGSAIKGHTSAQDALKSGLADPNATKEQLAGLESQAASATQAMAGAAGAALAGVQQILGSVVNGLDQLGMLTEEEKKDADNIIGMVGGAANLAMGIASGNPMQIIQGSVDLIVNGLQYFDYKSKDIAKRQKEEDQQIKRLSDAYGQLERATSKAFSAEKVRAQKQEVANLNAQILANEEWIAQEKRKKKKKQDKEAIADREKQIQELKNQIEDVRESMIESITGMSVMSAIDEFANAYADAFTSGEDAALKSAEVVKNILKSALIEKLKQDLQPGITELMNMISKAMSDGVITADEKAAIYAKNKENDAKAARDRKMFEELGLTDASNKSDQGIKGDVAKMSEETGTALVGQITAMRLNVSALLSTNKSAVDILSRQLAVQEEIKNNTSFCRRLDRIDETLYYMKQNGIKVQ